MEEGEGTLISCIFARSNHPFYHSSQQLLYGIILPRFTDSGQAEWLQRCISVSRQILGYSLGIVRLTRLLSLTKLDLLLYFKNSSIFLLQDIQLSVNSLLLLRDQKNMHDSSPLSVFGGSEEKTRNRSDQIQVYPSSPDFTVSPSACDYFTTHSSSICSVCYKLIPFLVILKKIPLCASLQGSEL